MGVDPKGGAVAASKNSSPDFRECRFSGNLADKGGALHFKFLSESSDVQIEDCVFDTNRAELYGGAIYSQTGQFITDEGPYIHPFFRIRRTDFYRNFAVKRGGAFFIIGRNARFENCKFGGNRVDNALGAATGSAIHAETSDEVQPGVVAINCLFTGNDAQALSTVAGAVYLTEWLIDSDPVPEYRPSTANFYHCTFSRNSATGAGTNFAELEVVRGDADFRNCIFWNDDLVIEAADEIDTVTGDAQDSVSFQNCIVEGSGGSAAWNLLDAEDRGGNLDANPVFADSDGPNDNPGTELDDLHLLSGSAAFASGDEILIPPDEYDFDADGNTTESFPQDLHGSSRILIDKVDMGLTNSSALASTSPTAPTSMRTESSMTTASGMPVTRNTAPSWPASLPTRGVRSEPARQTGSAILMTPTMC